jgi:hypothetical protein
LGAILFGLSILIDSAAIFTLLSSIGFIELHSEKISTKTVQ